jgi:putative transposase
MQKRKYNSDLSHRWKRKSLRMKAHNYSWTGTYFITIRAVQREPIFETPELRAILTETWQTLPERFPGITLDEFVIMPDHIHFIIWIEGNVEKPASLGDVIGAYKSLTAIAWLRHIKATGMECSARIWQHNYHEHAIRDNEELEQKRQYIRDNPIKSKKHEQK